MNTGKENNKSQKTRERKIHQNKISKSPTKNDKTPRGRKEFEQSGSKDLSEKDKKKELGDATEISDETTI